MDIRCPICGEPWDMDCIHERVAELYISRASDERYYQELYDEFYLLVKNAFYKRGCKALGHSHNEVPDKNAALLSSVLMDILGDDIDGIASELNDAEYFGPI